MSNSQLIPRSKKYTTFRRKVALQEGLIPEECCGITMACVVYRAETGGREVFITNVSENRRAKGTSPLELLGLDANKGTVLKIHIEGVDDEAKFFRDELKKGLTTERYLWDTFHPRYELIRPKY